MKRFILITNIFFAFLLKGFNQNDTIIYYAGNFKPSDKENALSYDEIKKVKKDKFEILSYWKNQDNWLPTSKKIIKILNDSILEISIYYNGRKNSEMIRELKYDKNGFYYFKDYYEDGNIKIEGKTTNKFPLHKIGEIKEYYKNGKIERISVFENNQLKSNQLWNEDGSKYMDNVFLTVDEMPQFPGGDLALQQYIARKVIYPKVAKKNGIQGRVFVRFIVMEDGSVDGVKIVRGVDPALDNAAIEVIKSIKAKWVPAILDGKNVRVAYTTPINFVLN